MWSFQYKTEMASQYNFVHPAAQAPAVNAQRIQVNDKFAQTADLLIAVQRSFIMDGRTVWADEWEVAPRANYTDALEQPLMLWQTVI